jgi:hypothetical protein
VAEYARNSCIIEEPASPLWAPQHLKKRNRLIKLSESCHVLKGYKFGIQIPTFVEEALALDEANSNTLWYNAIMKEAANVRIAFEIPKDGRPPPGYKHIQATYDDI